MARQEKTSKGKKPSMRDLAGDKSAGKKRRIRASGTKTAAPLKKIRGFASKEYHPIKLPDNKAGRLLNKRGRIIPKYFRESWHEIRLTTWPGRKETLRLTIAVFIFSAVFAVIVAALDFVLGKLFKNLITG